MDKRLTLPLAFWLLFVATFVARSGFFIESFLTIFMKTEAGFDASLAAFLMTLYGLGGALTSLLSGPLVDRFGPGKPLLVSLVLTASAAVLLAIGVPTWSLSSGLRHCDGCERHDAGVDAVAGGPCGAAIRAGEIADRRVADPIPPSLWLCTAR